MTQYYNANVAVNSDTCWMNAKDNNNISLEKYSLYYNDSSKEKNNYGSLPHITFDHVNLRGRPGYGLSDDYLIDNYSELRNNPNSMTRDRCSIQLTTRLFSGGPKLYGKNRDINKELDFLSGSDSRNIYDYNNENIKCNKSIMEKSMNNMIPLLDCIKEVQNPENIVPRWTRGGDDTRSYINKLKFSKCSKNTI